jgi:uncharacterized delta-60 repeat protein
MKKQHVRLGTLCFLILALGPMATTGMADRVRQVWAKQYNDDGNDDYGRAICTDAADNVYVAGFSIYPNGDWKIATVKYNRGGVQQWAVHYDSPDGISAEGRKIALDPAGNVYVAGSYNVLGTDNDYVVIKYNGNGEQLWARRYDSAEHGYDYLYDMAVDSDGNVHLTGAAGGDGIYGTDYATVKFSSTGNLLWEARYNGPFQGDDSDTAYAMTLDESGNVYVTGGSSGFEDFATIKYDAAGNELWVARYDSRAEPPNDSDYASDIAVDASGNVYVTGSSLGVGSFFDYLTIKYDPNGEELWVQRYNGPGNGIDHANALGIDHAGNVVITGEAFWDPFYRNDYTTIKYDPAGNMQWLARFKGRNPTEPFYDEATALAIDSADNVYVTGFSGPLYYSDYVTLKYDSSGRQRWIAAYDGPAHGYDLSRAIALGQNGRVYVTGEVPNGIDSWDFATVAYVQRASP